MFEKAILQKRELMCCLGQMWMYHTENEKQTHKYWVL